MDETKSDPQFPNAKAAAHGNTSPQQNSSDEKDSGGIAIFLKDIARYTIVALLIIVPLRAYVAQPFYVVGSSMAPTFNSGEYLIIDELSYQLRDPRRGEVIIFRFPKQPSLYFIKRVIGLPGETVEIRGNTVFVHAADGMHEFALNEPYVAPEHQRTDYSVTVLGKDEYFVMGDNREASLDSRAWGPLPREYIVGRVLVRLFPVTRIDWMPGVSSENQETPKEH
ncbi:signal peptidase I [Candidatus Parcubacteria bacterium]|nr:MAG: signal peptidase I [Candidatus Parcubacteria bacterium]GIW69191.1 MAG: signal peptidase I [Candidatus Parcubacteria bacterium]